MNRRELFKALGASMAAAAIPFPVAALAEATDQGAVLRYLKRAQLDLIHKITNPPMLCDEQGRLTHLTDLQEVWQEALRHITLLIEDYER